VHDSKIYNARVTVEIGRGFYDIGLELATRVLQNKSESKFYSLSPAVVNFTFATELYLKALRKLIDLPDSGSHELLSLYSGIPVEEKKKIE